MARSIVLTGGPGAGKTAVANRLAAVHPQLLVIVPEAASQVYAMLQTRWDRLDVEGRRDVQRRIYSLQIEQEERIARAHPRRALLLDRGTVDGAAYWPDGAEDYFREVGTTLDAEYARYDLVIWLECSAAIGAYDGEDSNPCRYEDAAAAIGRGDELARLWSAHRGFRRVRACRTLEEKVAAVWRVIQGESQTR